MSETQMVDDGTVVTMHYVLTTAEGDVIDRSAEGKPMAYLHGADNIVAGLEKQLSGKQAGDTVDAVVPPAEAYGERVGAGPQPIPRTAFPDGADLVPGMQVVAQGKTGETFPLWVTAVTPETVSVDANHPLAGMTLHFQVEIVDVRPASQEEVAHGHPQGPAGGHKN